MMSNETQEKFTLGEAYKRAGRAFTGQLDQHFLVLKDEQSISPNQFAWGPFRNSRKRPMEKSINGL
jgi:hypothetical protein